MKAYLGHDMTLNATALAIVMVAPLDILRSHLRGLREMTTGIAGSTSYYIFGVLCRESVTGMKASMSGNVPSFLLGSTNRLFPFIST